MKYVTQGTLSLSFNRYHEVCDPGYTFTPPPSSFGGGTGHFTQIVWKTSVKLGVGMAETTMNGNKCIFTVGRYREPGNWGGKFGENVVQGKNLFACCYCC